MQGLGFGAVRGIGDGRIFGLVEGFFRILWGRVGSTQKAPSDCKALREGGDFTLRGLD